ncbi:hypothetical protein [Flocculibacter collagenilyticus]|uniref:hypothetical protein n=1 Tax=Flocculibacter collagenilyticus TaxID=2744479 RepID=UPI0018F6FA44|nr:hypothetical protein [Flocculibacter collagenilyticus]
MSISITHKFLRVTKPYLIGAGVDTSLFSVEFDGTIIKLLLEERVVFHSDGINTLYLCGEKMKIERHTDAMNISRVYYKNELFVEFDEYYRYKGSAFGEECFLVKHKDATFKVVRNPFRIFLPLKVTCKGLPSLPLTTTFSLMCLVWQWHEFDFHS